uniref:F-box domain-containing protein n=1 Tax=Pyramimonas obovata TaxID=1411642 RepID=A0A7S0RM29_9CHLO|mmetsp:Transcript_37409/g.81454  ORF Transcript_37409/g.81454 Transcript_37409/m.81454 type:complete len:413 (+) Transcript_37409:151-1389(+)
MSVANLSMKGEQKPGPTGVPYVTPLKDLCVRVVSQNFEERPHFGRLPDIFVRKIIEGLDIDLPLELVGTVIHDENYWKRRCCARWKNCQVTGHGISWKQLYFERNVENAMERYDPQTTEINALKRLFAFSKKFVRSVCITQLPSHLDLQLLFDNMASCLTSLSLTYGMMNVGMDYDRSLFGMKLSDCRSLAKALERTETLTYLNLSGNLLDDEKVRMVASGLVDNLSVTHLNLSHNKIADRGVRALAKLLDSKSVIGMLELADNQVHTEGGRALARALRANHSLLALNLRLNRIGDEGGRALCDVLRSNTSLQRLNLGANELSHLTALSLAALIGTNSTVLDIDVTSNNFGPEGGKQIREALEDNRTVRKIDLRLCNIGTDHETAIMELVKAHGAGIDFNQMGHAGYTIHHR